MPEPRSKSQAKRLDAQNPTLGYRGFTIRRDGDAFYASTGGVIKLGPFAKVADARRAVDAELGD